MNKIKNIIIVILITIIFGLSVFIIYFLLLKDNINDEVIEIELDTTTKEIQETTEHLVSYKVDIKGAVNNPGVYELSAGSVVNDVIIMAGGTTKNANTNNINLSQKIYDSMVIYVFTNAELTTTKSPILNDVKCTTNVIEINNCITTTTTKTTTTTTRLNTKVNINTASKEELMTLTGIGESKADTIIEYRINNRFNKIEDIMNISGIGEAAFEKIKDYITV